MGWREWPKWLRGGVIGSIIGIIILTCGLLIDSLGILTNTFEFLLYPYFLYAFRLIGQFGAWDTSNFLSYLGYFGGYVFMAAIYFIMGAIIGWIVGKFKE